MAKPAVDQEMNAEKLWQKKKSGGAYLCDKM